jgi:hypothetical protein
MMREKLCEQLKKIKGLSRRVKRLTDYLAASVKEEGTLTDADDNAHQLMDKVFA